MDRKLTRVNRGIILSHDEKELTLLLCAEFLRKVRCYHSDRVKGGIPILVIGIVWKE